MDSFCCLKCFIGFVTFALLFGLPLAYWYRTAPAEDYLGQYGPVEAQNFGHGNGEKQ